MKPKITEVHRKETNNHRKAVKCRDPEIKIQKMQLKPKNWHPKGNLRQLKCSENHQETVELKPM